MATCDKLRAWNMGIRTLLDHHQRQVNRAAWPDLGGFLFALDAAGQLKQVDEPVSPELEITALCRHSLLHGGPALRFDEVQGTAMPVVGNLFGNERRVLMALELESRDALRDLGKQFAFLRNPELPDGLGKALDADPGTLLAAVTPVPDTLSEYAFAGLLRGQIGRASCRERV